MNHSENVPVAPQRAIRLIFKYEGKDIKLVSKQTLEMLAPPSDPLEVGNDEVGFWLEIRDRKKRVRYRKVMFNPIMYAVELRSNDLQRPLFWQDVKEPKGEFVVLVPEIEGAQRISFLSNQVERKEGLRLVQEIAQFDLTEEAS